MLAVLVQIVQFRDTEHGQAGLKVGRQARTERHAHAQLRHTLLKIEAGLGRCLRVLLRTALLAVRRPSFLEARL